jgi:hypothetical protein
LRPAVFAVAGVNEFELIPGRRESRKLVIAAGLTDDDIDALIKRAQREVEPLLPQ